MLIFIDKRAPETARQTLRKYGEVVEFSTKGIVYEAISGHPDIFMCQTPETVVVAPNIPAEFLAVLDNNHINFVFGKNPVGIKYPETAIYNAVVTEKYLVHNITFSDPVILNVEEKKQIIPVKQAYTRCNLLFLNENAAITSDKGIEKQLAAFGVRTLFVDPAGVELPGFKHGFFGVRVVFRKIRFSSLESYRIIIRAIKLWILLKKRDSQSPNFMMVNFLMVAGYFYYKKIRFVLIIYL